MKNERSVDAGYQPDTLWIVSGFTWRKTDVFYWISLVQFDRPVQLHHYGRSFPWTKILLLPKTSKEAKGIALVSLTRISASFSRAITSEIKFSPDPTFSLQVFTTSTAYFTRVIWHHLVRKFGDFQLMIPLIQSYMHINGTWGMHNKYSQKSADRAIIAVIRKKKVL